MVNSCGTLRLVGNALIQAQETLEDRQRAVSDALAWGFPREPFEYEIELGHWFRLPHVVWWYEAGPDGGTDMAIHIAVDPEFRGRWAMRPFIREFLTLAHRAGAKRLFSFPMDDVSGGLLERLGFTRFDGGLVRVLEA